MKTQRTNGTSSVTFLLAVVVGLSSACGGGDGVCIDRDGTTVCVLQSALDDGAYCDPVDTNYTVCGAGSRLALQTYAYSAVVPVPAVCKQCVGQLDLSQADRSEPCQSCFQSVAFKAHARMATPAAHLGGDRFDSHHSATPAAAPTSAASVHHGHHVAAVGSKHVCPICAAHVATKGDSPSIATPDGLTK
ncbi:MAG: hypothetical protein KC503_42300 [Myxococcales bacterium]|nr:hypothetical protein [Myxococcales bacterium]